MKKTKIKTLRELRDSLRNAKYFAVDEEGNSIKIWNGKELCSEYLTPSEAVLERLCQRIPELVIFGNPEHICLFKDRVQAMEFIKTNLSKINLAEGDLYSQLCNLQAVVTATASIDGILEVDAQILQTGQTYFKQCKKKGITPDSDAVNWCSSFRSLKNTCEKVRQEYQLILK